MFITNNTTLVSCAKECYRDFPTVVNNLKESGITYTNTPEAYAKMDNNLAKAQLDIGESSNLAQLALSYYWTEKAKPKEERNKHVLKDLYDNFVILAVLAQVAIDSCKREYTVKVRDEINRIRAMDCMKHDNPLPEFMENVKEVKLTKNGKFREYDDVKKDKDKIKNKISFHYQCPMNYLVKILNKIQGVSVADKIDLKLFIKDEEDGKVSRFKTTKLISIIEQYESKCYEYFSRQEEDRDYDELIKITNDTIEQIKKMKISKRTMNYVIRASIGDNVENNAKANLYKKHRRKILNLVYKANPKEFLKHFQNVKRINCLDCGKEMIIPTLNTKVCRCIECQKIKNREMSADAMRKKRTMLS